MVIMNTTVSVHRIPADPKITIILLFLAGNKKRLLFSCPRLRHDPDMVETDGLRAVNKDNLVYTVSKKQTSQDTVNKQWLMLQ